MLRKPPSPRPAPTWKLRKCKFLVAIEAVDEKVAIIVVAAKVARRQGWDGATLGKRPSKFPAVMVDCDRRTAVVRPGDDGKRSRF